MDCFFDTKSICQRSKNNDDLHLTPKPKPKPKHKKNTLNSCSGPFLSSSGNIKNSTHTHTHSREISEFYPFVRDFKLRYYFLSAGYKHDTIQCIHINSTGHAPDVSVSLNKWHLRSWQCQDRCQPNGRQSCLPWPSKGCLQYIYIYKPLKVSYPARTSTNTFQDI